MEGDFLENIDLEETFIDLTHSRLKDMRELNLERFELLEELGLRQNLFTKIEKLPLTIKRLDVYDNKIRDVGILSELHLLTYLDLSYNLIKEFKEDCFDKMTELKDLFLISNDLRVIPKLEKTVKLRNLELGANKIREIANLDNLISLEELWLGKNRIRQLNNLDLLTNLKILSTQSNRIHKIENLEKLINLEELYISHNGIDTIENLECNTKLRVLDISSNRIKKLDHLTKLAKLEELWANDNQIDHFQNLEALQHLDQLSTVYFERNPIQTNEPTAYRRKIILSLPQLTQIDATLIK